MGVAARRQRTGSPSPPGFLWTAETKRRRSGGAEAPAVPPAGGEHAGVGSRRPWAHPVPAAGECGGRGTSEGLQGQTTGRGRAMEGAKPCGVAAAWAGRGACPMGTQHEMTQRVTRGVTRLTRFFTHAGLHPWARRGSANAPTFLTFVLFSSVWIPLSMILTVIWPSDTSGRRKGGLTSTVCSALGRPRYLARAEVVRGRSGGRLGLPGHHHAAPRLPGGWGAAQDPADVLTATVGEGVDAAAELARHLRDEGHGAGTGSGCGTSPVPSRASTHPAHVCLAPRGTRRCFGRSRAPRSTRHTHVPARWWCGPSPPAPRGSR